MDSLLNAHAHAKAVDPSHCNQGVCSSVKYVQMSLLDQSVDLILFCRSKSQISH